MLCLFSFFPSSLLIFLSFLFLSNSQKISKQEKDSITYRNLPPLKIRAQVDISRGWMADCDIVSNIRHSFGIHSVSLHFTLILFFPLSISIYFKSQAVRDANNATLCRLLPIMNAQFTVYL